MGPGEEGREAQQVSSRRDELVVSTLGPCLGGEMGVIRVHPTVPGWGVWGTVG